MVRLVETKVEVEIEQQLYAEQYREHPTAWLSKFNIDCPMSANFYSAIARNLGQDGGCACALRP